MLVTSEQDGKYVVRFKYNRELVDSIKKLTNARWNPDKKYWTVESNSHNKYQLAKIQNSIEPYKTLWEHVNYIPKRKLYDHQIEMVNQILEHHYCILACEMGTGKTLVAIEAIENMPQGPVWYIAPKSGIEAVRREFKKWGMSRKVNLYTYESLKKIVEADPPVCIIYDESSKIKTPTAQRSQAAFKMAEKIRETHGKKGYVVLMSGTPAPRTPVDWWHQCEVAMPGYIEEGDHFKFKKKLAVIVQRESIAGGVYPEIVTWKDDENKCNECGLLSVDHQDITDHKFTKSRNEVKILHSKLTDGLVLIKFKKDCVDLPEKIYQEIQLRPTVEMLRLANSIKNTSPRAIEALTRLRELSDGFLYEDVDGEEINCPGCNGSGKITIPEEGDCDYCNGSGKVKNKVRSTREIGTPKDQFIIDELDAHEEIGRLIIWGGFVGTIDRLVKLVQSQGWATLRVDGRGFEGRLPDGELIDYQVLLDAMDGSNKEFENLLTHLPKVCFIGNPQAGGMALTLTGSPTMVFFSNSFDGTARMQSEDRFHRIGMDINRGATIKDLILLPTDKLVLENLRKKKTLQSITLGEIDEIWKEKKNSQN